MKWPCTAERAVYLPYVVVKIGFIPSVTFQYSYVHTNEFPSWLPRPESGMLGVEGNDVHLATAPDPTPMLYSP
jgi:hypothetical protein